MKYSQFTLIDDKYESSNMASQKELGSISGSIIQQLDHINVLEVQLYVRLAALFTREFSQDILAV